MPKVLKLIIMILLLATAACGSMVQRMDPLTIPAVDSVTSIETMFLDSYDQRTIQYNKITTLSDRKKIAALIRMLTELNTGMHHSLTTFPTPTHTIVVNDKDNLGLVVFIGKNWFGGRNNVDGDRGKNRLRTLSYEQRALLLHTAGIN